MKQDPAHVESSIVLASSSRAGGVPADGAVALPGVAPLHAPVPWPRLRVATTPRAARLALGALLAATFAVVLFATSGHSALVPQSGVTFPAWEAGPLHHLLGRLPTGHMGMTIGFSVVILVMLGAYGVLLVGVRHLSLRTIAISIVALHAIVLMSPPLQLTDLFNYLGYARLGGLHHLNPYTHGIAWEYHDPIYRFTTWHHLRSPYGPLFTAPSYLLAFLPIPVAYWLLKTVTLLASLGFIALVWHCARQLGRDPRFAVVFVALNPIYLMYAIAGFHNDFFMLIPSTAAIALLLARRDRAAGAVLMLAVAVKFTAVLLLPFLLVAARPVRRRKDILIGSVLGAVPLIAMSVAVFGFSLPNLVDQSTLLTDFSIPNLVGLVIGIGGGAPGLLRVGNVALVVAVAMLLRRRADWLSGAGWATLALIASLAWLVPWYVLWLLPLACLSTNLRLRRSAVALTVFLVLAFVPVTNLVLSRLGIDPLGSSVGHASRVLQKKLEQ